METSLNPYEARVIGVLIEKAFTTPDQYPLSLNATTNACNQKSCRNPVTDYTEAEILLTLKGLRMKHMAGGTIPANSRVERWHHSAKEHWKLDEGGLAVLAELLLRGPQSASQLKTNAGRMRAMSSAEELLQVVAPLEAAGLVKLLPAGRGSRVAQYAQTLAALAAVEVAPAERADEKPQVDASPDLLERVERLERQLKGLADKLGEPLGE